MIPGDLAFRTLPPVESLLLLLVSGHVLADFLVQTEAVAARKGRHAGVLLIHAGATLVTHAILLLPFWSRELIAPLLALGAFHLALDAVKGRLEDRAPGRSSLRALAADQALHAAGLLGVWIWLRQAGVATEPVVVIPDAWLAPVAAWSLIAAALAFCGKGGTAVVRSLLARYPALLPRERPSADDRPDSAAASDEYEMGRTIGILERLIVFLLVLAGQWGALGLVLAAKSIARFPELKDQRFADYYLLGTLASILTAVAVGMAVGLAVF